MTSTLSHSDTITSAELRGLLVANPDVCMVDVRTGGEFESRHIPGSVNVPLDALATRAGDLAAVDQPVVLVCQTGNRATQAQALLVAEGKDNVHVLDGGVIAWDTAGGEVAQGLVERWAMDRQVRLAAGSLVLTGMAASVKFPPAKWLAGAIGGGLTFSAVSNTCTMGDMLAKLPYNKTEPVDIAETIAQLNAGPKEIQL